jgi:hypothetical protein
MTEALERPRLPVFSRDDVDRYVAQLAERFGDRLVSVVLFGSRARGQAKAESDVDLLVVIRGLPRNRSERYKGFRDIARAVADDFANLLALILATPEEAVNVKPYYLGMLSGHEILCDRDGFFASVLERLRRRLQELGSRRHVDPDGYEYWDLKPDWKPGDVVEL